MSTLFDGFDPARPFCDLYISQAVKDVRTSKDALIYLFGRMESFFKRLEKYIQFRPTVAMTDIIVKIMVEVISILGIVTKEIGQGKTSMPCLLFVSSKADLHSEISQEVVSKE